LGAAQSEDFVIPAYIVLIQIKSVTDGQTDAQAMAKTCEAFCYRS